MTSRAEKQREKMQSDADSDTATEETTDMSNDTDGVETAQAPAQTITDFGSLYPRQQTRTRWTVLNLAGESPTAYLVDTRELDCSCGDHEYRSDDGEVCKHLAAALHASKQQIGTEELSRWSLQHALSDAKEAAQTAGVLSDRLDQALVETRSATAEAVSEDGSTDSAEATADAVAQDAAEKLQTAFDDVIDDMQVEANDGLVWFQTGQDTPDEWPFPGGDETFSVVTNPDSVSYAHDGSDDWADGPHKHHDSKPGEWFKNALDPEDVDEYVSEVLE